jgi:hypothetical protein
MVIALDFLEQEDGAMLVGEAVEGHLNRHPLERPIGRREQ